MQKLLASAVKLTQAYKLVYSSLHCSFSLLLIFFPISIFPFFLSRLCKRRKILVKALYFGQSFHRTYHVQLFKGALFSLRYSFHFMILKYMMEEKQLNFNQPLLSVRRGPEVNLRKTDYSHPSFSPLPFYKSELKSGPVRNPGAVPFQWEQTPGKPKDENKEQRVIIKQLPLAPKLPPGRVVNHEQKLTDKANSSSRSHGETNIPCSIETSAVDKQNISSSEDENMMYEDAQDTLSRTESSLLNCSVSGVSGLDVPNMKPSGAFSDPQARDFMMGRFLPAAKAVTSEAPQFASRKQPMVRVQPKPVKNVVTKRFVKCQDIHNTLSHNIHMELEGEEEEDEYDDAEYLSAKLCGLLPKFYLLNPIPGIRDHAQVISSVGSAPTKPAYAGVCRKSEHKDRINNQGEPNRITRQYCPTNKSSLNDHYGNNGIAVAQWKKGSPHSFFGRERGFLDLPKEPIDFRANKLESHIKRYTKFKALLADHSAEEEITCPVIPAIEKTLHVDSEQRVEPEDSNSSSWQTRGSKPSADQNVSLVVKEGTQESCHLLALAPFLPKSPSESWLSRTLLSMSSKNPSSCGF